MRTTVGLLLLTLGPRLAEVRAQVSSTTGRQQPLAITAVTVIDVESGRSTSNQTVVVEGGRISWIGDDARASIPRDARRVDGRGGFLIPGLIDTHVHLALGADRDSLRALPVYLAHGVTGIRDAGAGGQDEWLVSLRQRIARGEVLGPRMYVSGLVSGRSVARAGGDARALARRLAAAGVDGLKIRDGLRREDIRATIAAATELGLPVYGHTYDAVNRDHDEIYTLDAIRDGVRGTMHVLGMPQLGTNQPPSPPAGPRFQDWQAWWVHYASYWLDSDSAAERRLIDTMVARHAWLEPTLVTEDWVANADKYRASWSTRGIPKTFDEAYAGFPVLQAEATDKYRRSFARMKDFVGRFHRTGGVVVTGTDCTPQCGYGVQEELRLLVDAGLTPAEALRAATRDAARVLGWADSVGVVKRGYVADLVILDADPLRDIANSARVRAVVVGGRYLVGADLRRPAPSRTP